MTPEEIRKKLEESGVQTESWISSNAKRVHSPMIEKQKENLRTLEVLLKKQIEQDQQRVAELYATLQRIKHGGGVRNG